MRIYIYDHEDDKSYNIPIPNFMIFNKVLIKFAIRIISKKVKNKELDSKAEEKLDKLKDTEAFKDAINSLYRAKKKYGKFVLVEINEVGGDKVKITI